MMLSFRAVAALLATGFVLLSAPAAAYVGLCCGKCGGNMPMNIPGGGIPETYEWRVKLSGMFMRMDELRDGSDDIDEDDLLGMPVMMGAPTGKFMAVPTRMDMQMLNVSAGYSFSDRFFVGAMFMYRNNRMDMKFNSAMQALTGQRDFTMDSDGPGDTMLMAKYRLFADDPLIPKQQASLLFGLSVPTGSINQKNSNHPLEMRRNEHLPYGMQLGSGTFDPSLGFLYQQSSSPWWWGANASYTARLYDNSRDYRLGDEFRLDGYLMYQLRYDFLLQAQLNGAWQDSIRGEMDVARDGSSGHVTQGDPSSPYTTPLWDPDHYGGVKLALTVGFQWQPVPLQIIDFNVSVPVYQDLNGPQMADDFRVMLTWYIERPTRRSVRYGLDRGPADSRLGF